MFNLKGNKKIYVVTNRNLVKERCFYDVIEECAEKGADGIILREKDLSYEALKKMAQIVKKRIDKYGVPLIINGNLKVAKEIDAFAFHTGFQAFKEIIDQQKLNPNDEAYKYSLKEKNLFIGVSIHTVEEAIEASNLGADYVIAGNVFETDCKPGLKGKGLDFINSICSSVDIPVIAIGGINPNNIEDILNTAAAGVAVMSYAMKM